MISMINSRSEKIFAINSIIKTSLPIIASMASALIMMMSDRIILARYSSETLAASGPAIFTAIAIIVFFTGTAGITRTYIAQKNGERDYPELRRIALKCFTLGIFLGAILLALQPLIKQIPYLNSLPRPIQDLESQYLSLAPFYGFFMILNVVFSSIYIGRLNTKICMYVGMAGNVINIFLTIAFVYGVSFFPELGMNGSAVGTLISVFIVSVIYIYYLRKDNLLILRDIEIDSLRFLPILRMGVNKGASASMEDFGHVTFIWAVGMLGQSALIANNIALALNYLAIVPIIGLSIGCSTIIANHVGNGEDSKVLPTIYLTFLIGISYILIVSFVEINYSRILIYPFISSDLSIESRVLSSQTVQVLWLYALAFNLSMLMTSCLEAIKYTKPIFWCRVAIFWGLNVPAIVWLTSSNQGKQDLIITCWVIGSFFELSIGVFLSLLFVKRFFNSKKINK
ncbi:hypothetical protein L1D16_21880 [Vibrio sp. Isolate31]|uniref:MATE family efflux transporter n=1 Tax=unclassified Vibrio TaxID=2614977 RepID=UPI001EFC74F6|nr:MULTISPECIES: MATE family efflux transporter [unclassified Vibrio]MCG9553548.1 hypothetical protein [Vibrio sp. Isolate32]MCG9603370.1 hypothetical protein [Vibrio sp. Isolate31]